MGYEEQKRHLPRSQSFSLIHCPSCTKSCHRINDSTIPSGFLWYFFNSVLQRSVWGFYLDQSSSTWSWTTCHNPTWLDRHHPHPSWLCTSCLLVISSVFNRGSTWPNSSTSSPSPPTSLQSPPPAPSSLNPFGHLQPLHPIPSTPLSLTEWAPFTLEEVNSPLSSKRELHSQLHLHNSRSAP